MLVIALPSFGQVKGKTSKPDSVRVKSEINELENLRQQLTEKIQKLKLACRQDSIGILNVKNKKKDADHQTTLLMAGITDLENLKDKTKEQKKLLRDLKKGHAELREKFASLDNELNGIEKNYRNTLVLISDADNLIKDLAGKLLELHKLISP